MEKFAPIDRRWWSLIKRRVKIWAKVARCSPGKGKGRKEKKKNGNAFLLAVETEYILNLLISFQRYVSFGTQRKPTGSG